MKLPELKEFFKDLDIKEPLKIDSCTVIFDFRRCVDSCISSLESHPKNKGYLPYYDLLMKIVNHISKTKNHV
jgi:hypothetical protein